MAASADAAGAGAAPAPPRNVDNPLVRAVGRLPATVRTKLVVAFLLIAAVLVLVALLGLNFLGQANARAQSLRTLQVRAAAYGELETNATALRTQLGLCAGGADAAAWSNGGKAPKASTVECLRQIDRSVATTLALLGNATHLEFSPRGVNAVRFREIRSLTRSLRVLIAQITKAPKPTLPMHAHAENLAIALETRATALADATTTETNRLIAQNRASYANSRNLFIGVAAGAVLLALGLGFVLAWSLVDPIRRIEKRLAEIAAGDFDGRLDVSNRDELGALATNVNRMNAELQRLYRELESTSRHKSEFLANMSHELRTPLNAIIGFSQVLRERMFGDVNAKQEEYLDDILSSGNHLLSLINDVLDLSKVEAGQVELEIAPFSLSEALERGVVMMRERAAADGVTLSVEHASDVGAIRADERRVRQIVFNLLSNAVKFTPAGGRVTVTSSRVNGEVRVAVSDTGPGIDPRDQDRIFEEFQQTDVGSAQREGTGLGLALSKRLVELHGGRIWVESAPGRGSRFLFTLPL